MTIEGQVTQILATVNAQTQTLTALTQAVASLSTSGSTGTPVDLTPITAALTALQTTASAIQADLETDGSAPAQATTPSA